MALSHDSNRLQFSMGAHETFIHIIALRRARKTPIGENIKKGELFEGKGKESLNVEGDKIVLSKIEVQKKRLN